VAGVLWVVVSVGVAFAGLVVLAVCAFKVFLAVRGLARELERTRRRLEPRQKALQGELQTLRRAADRTPIRTAYDRPE
jgi:membrane protein implicated in regulation of membrane protease activity